GNYNLENDVRSVTNGAKNLQLTGCEPCNPQTSPIFSRVSDFRVIEETGPSAESVNRLTRFRFSVGLKPEALPRQYSIKLLFKLPENGSHQSEEVPVDFPLFAGVREHGLLKVDEQRSKPLACIGGATREFTFTLYNAYVDYDVHLQKLKLTSNVDGLVVGIVSSDPAGQIDPKTNTITFNPPLVITPAQHQPVAIKARLAGLATAGNYLTGFDSDAQVTFKFLYDDSYQRPLSDLEYALPLHVRPSTAALLVAVLLGALVGVVIMSAWRILKYEGGYWRKASLIGSTILVGLIVSIIALQGQVNVSFDAVDLRASYDKPVVLFLLSLFATVSGTPLLRKFLGLYKASTAGVSAAAPPASGSEA